MEVIFSPTPSFSCFPPVVRHLFECEPCFVILGAVGPAGQPKAKDKKKVRGMCVRAICRVCVWSGLVCSSAYMQLLQANDIVGMHSMYCGVYMISWSHMVITLTHWPLADVAVIL